MSTMLSMDEKLKREEELLHAFVFRDKIKSSEYHYSVPFECDGFFDDFLLNKVFEKIVLLSKEIEFETFKVGVLWGASVEDAEKLRLKSAFQSPLIRKIESELGKRAVVSAPDLEFLIDFEKNLVLVRIHPVYVRGNYCKYSREIAQTEFFCNKCRGHGCWYCEGTGHFSENSVEEMLAEVFVPAFNAKLLIMHGAGREDMDVLMLGKGRPFIAELLLPMKRSADLKKLESELNKKCKDQISVNSLSLCSTFDVAPLKDTLHDKVYCALVSTDKVPELSKLKLNELIKILQKTPTRVAKRRADLERSKEITILRATPLSDNEFVLVLKTSHGTYVKEFISSDGGKTNPSLSSLLKVKCTCSLLDVLEICG